MYEIIRKAEDKSTNSNKGGKAAEQLKVPEGPRGAENRTKT